MIFGRRKKEVVNRALLDLAWAQRLSTLPDLQYLTSALDISEQCLKSVRDGIDPEVGRQAASIVRAVLPQVQKLGLVRCQSLIQTADRLLEEEKYEKAREAADEARHVFDNSRLWMERMPVGNKPLSDAINDMRGIKTARPMGRRAIRSARQILESGESAFLMDHVVSYLDIASAEVKNAADPELEASVAELGMDSRVLAFKAQRTAEKLAADKHAAEVAQAELFARQWERQKRQEDRQEEQMSRLEAFGADMAAARRIEANYGRKAAKDAYREAWRRLHQR